MRRAEFDQHVDRARRDDARSAKRRDGPRERHADRVQTANASERNATEAAERREHARGPANSVASTDGSAGQDELASTNASGAATSTAPNAAAGEAPQAASEATDNPSKSERSPGRDKSTPDRVTVDAPPPATVVSDSEPTLQLTAPESAVLDAGEPLVGAKGASTSNGGASKLASKPDGSAQAFDAAAYPSSSPQLAEATESPSSSTSNQAVAPTEASPQRFELQGANAAARPTDGAPAMQPIEAPARATDAAAALDKPPPTAPQHEAALSAERAADVLRQVRLQITPQMRQAVIQLEPREMGRIAIKVSVTRGVVKAELRAEKRSTLDALERHAPELKSALERVGLVTNSLALEFGFDGAASQRSGDDANAQPRSKGASFGDAAPNPTSNAMRALARRVVDSSGVDTYA